MKLNLVSPLWCLNTATNQILTRGLYDKVQLMVKEFFRHLLILWGKHMPTSDTENPQTGTQQALDYFPAQHAAVQLTSSRCKQLQPTTRPLLSKVHVTAHKSLWLLGRFIWPSLSMMPAQKMP